MSGDPWLKKDCKEAFLHCLNMLNPDCITNKHILEIFTATKRSKIATWKEIMCTFENIYDDDFSDLNEQTFRSYFEAVYTKYYKLLRIKSTEEKQKELEKFHHQKWSILSLTERQRKSQKRRKGDDLTIIVRKKGKTELLAEGVKDEVTSKLAEENNILTQRNHKLSQEIWKMKEENERLKKYKVSNNCRRIRQDLGRKMKQVIFWRKKYRELSSQVTQAAKLQSKLQEAKQTIKRLRATKRKQDLRHKEKLLANKLENIYKTSVIEVNNKTILDQKEDTITNLELQLEDQEVPDISNTIETKRDGKTFTPQIREACYHLQNLGVSQKNVSVAIKLVTKAITGKELIGSLPSHTTQNLISKEMASLSRQQIKECVTQADSLTLKYDGTTKKVGHLAEVEISTEHDTFLVGIKNQTSGTAVEYVNTIQTCLNEVEASPLPNQNKNVTGNLLQKVKNTMSDRCITNTAIHRKLEDITQSKMNQFKCGMHPLDTMAKDCEKIIKQFESNRNINKIHSMKMPYMYRGESMTQALIRVVSKLFHSTQYSCSGQLKSYLTQEGVSTKFEKQSIQYHHFVGNRFHIYFLNAGLLFHYFEALKEFFTSVFPPRNSVHTAVLNSLTVEDIKIPLRALGIIGKCITGPYMRCVGKNMNILDLNPRFCELQRNLEVWSHDATKLLEIPLPSAFKDIPVLEDPILSSLATPMTRSTDADTIELLQELCNACLDVVNRQLQSHLPGGEFWLPTKQLQAEARTCSSTNMSGERNFASIDSEIGRAKNAKLPFLEGRVMFRRNKTGAWLQNMSEGCKASQCNLAMKEGRRMAKEEKLVQKNLEEKRNEEIKKSRREMLTKENKQREKYEGILETVFENGGLWEANQVNENVNMIRTKTGKIKALKAQINVRTKFLKVGCDRAITMTKASIPEMSDYLRELCQCPVPDEQEDVLLLIQNPISLVGQCFIQRWIEDDHLKFYNGCITDCIDQLDFKLIYDHGEIIYMTADELIVDIVQGDLDLYTE